MKSDNQRICVNKIILTIKKLACIDRKYKVYIITNACIYIYIYRPTERERERERERFFNMDVPLGS